MISVSLIISTYNNPRFLEQVLARILSQTVKPAEVLIADDGSGPETKSVIDRFAASTSIPVEHIWQEDKGFRKTIILNRAIRRAKGDYVVQIDGDVLMDRHFIADHIKHASLGAFIRGTRVNLSSALTDKILSNKHFGFFDRLKVKLAQPFNAFRLPFSLAATKMVMDGSRVKGCNMSFWRADLLKINGYDNTLAGWGHEDEELACRLVNAGVAKKVVKMSAVVYHLYHPELSRSDEPDQRRHVDKVVADKTIVTPHGINQLPND